MLMAARPDICELQHPSTTMPTTDSLGELRHALQASPYLPLRRLRCVERNGFVQIVGDVPSYYLKQLAHSLACKILGNPRIENQVDVVPPGSRYSMRGATFGAALPQQPR